MIEPTFLSLEEVLTLHADQLERYGGAAGVRDLGLLESAVETPRATFDGEFLHDGLFAMAAAYAFHIAESQALTETSAQASTQPLCSCSSMAGTSPILRACCMMS